MTRVLFVCLGNICRSPAAEGVFRTMAQDAGLTVSTDSAGTGGWHVGDPPYAPMIEAARQRGHDLSDLRARQVGPADFHRYDLICVMDKTNLDDMEKVRPAGNETPVKLLLDFDPDATDWTVPDPYYTRDFDTALNLIEAGCAGLVAHLSSGRNRQGR